MAPIFAADMKVFALNTTVYPSKKKVPPLHFFTQPKIVFLSFLFSFFLIFFKDKSCNLFKFVSVLLSASVERVGVSRMRDFYSITPWTKGLKN